MQSDLHGTPVRGVVCHVDAEEEEPRLWHVKKDARCQARMNWRGNAGSSIQMSTGGNRCDAMRKATVVAFVADEGIELDDPERKQRKGNAGKAKVGGRNECVVEVITKEWRYPGCRCW